MNREQKFNDVNELQALLRRMIGKANVVTAHWRHKQISSISYEMFDELYRAQCEAEGYLPSALVTIPRELAEKIAASFEDAALHVPGGNGEQTELIESLKEAIKEQNP